MEKKYTCIAIDDEKDSLYCIQREIEHSLVFDLVEVFTDFSAAIAYLSENTIDLILCDIELSDEVLTYEHLTEFPSTSVIIFITGQPKYFLRGAIQMKEACNVIGCSPKPFINSTLVEIEKCFLSYLTLGGKETIENLRNEINTISLFRNQECINTQSISYSEIIMIFPYRFFRGIVVYSLVSPRPLYKKNMSLEKCFEELQSNSPDAFIAVGRNGIVNRKNVKICHDCFFPKLVTYSTEKLEMEIPLRLRSSIKKLME